MPKGEARSSSATQGSMMLGALIGRGLIDAAGATGPLTAAITILVLGTGHTFYALRPALQPEAA
jgi:hypothetical protein